MWFLSALYKTVWLFVVRNSEACHFFRVLGTLSQFVYSIFHVFRQIVKNELVVLQQRTAVELPAESCIKLAFVGGSLFLSANSYCCHSLFIFVFVHPNYFLFRFMILSYYVSIQLWSSCFYVPMSSCLK